MECDEHKHVDAEDSVPSLRSIMASLALLLAFNRYRPSSPLAGLESGRPFFLVLLLVCVFASLAVCIVHLVSSLSTLHAELRLEQVLSAQDCCPHGSTKLAVKHQTRSGLPLPRSANLKMALATYSIDIWSVALIRRHSGSSQSLVAAPTSRPWPTWGELR